MFLSHALWNGEITKGIEDNISNTLFEFGGKNTTGAENYMILDAVGKGHYVELGFVLSIAFLFISLSALAYTYML